MWHAIVEADFRITLPEELRSQVQVGDQVLLALNPAERRARRPEVQVNAILAETAGLWQNRTDLPADGVAYVQALRQSPAAASGLVFDEMIAFLSGRPTVEQIAAFKISAGAQARLAELLEKNREEGLSDAENAELDGYEYVHDIMLPLKARARSGAASAGEA